MTMITFDTSDAKFTYRVVAVIIDSARQRVLLHKDEQDDFWAPPGGRCEMLEPAQDALRREMLEELGADVTVERLLWVAENFFDYNMHRHHVLGLYFLVRLPDDSSLFENEIFYGIEEGIKLIFQWFPLDELESTALFPTFLRKGLGSLPETIQHVVYVDEEELTSRP